MIELNVPPVGESIHEVTLVKWLKDNGTWVERDEILCELESEKATFELTAEKAGTLIHVAHEGDTLHIGDLACKIDNEATQTSALQEAVVIAEKKSAQALTFEFPATEKTEPVSPLPKTTPLASQIMADKHVDAETVHGSGSLGRITKQDVLSAISHAAEVKPSTTTMREVSTVKMSNLRKTISRRLVEAKNSTAMLTTFNEVDMSAIMEIRKANKDTFKAKHQIGLGFMSFFTRACCIALKEWKAVNAYINGDEIIYHEYCDISIAVSAPKGLVVPVIRNAEQLSMADIEKQIALLASKAKENKLSIEEMTGGTFTITNGGIFGSLLSTPIINIPQSAILGMHKIQERPIAFNGQVVIRPMMYLALSYDHRIIDGRESVGFLVRVKELLESPDLLINGLSPTTQLLDL